MKRIFSMLLVAAMALGSFSACESDNNTDNGDNGTTPTSPVGTNWSDALGMITLSCTSETSVTQSMAGINVTYDYTYADGQGTVRTGEEILYTFKVNGNVMTVYNTQGEVVYTLTKTDGNTPTNNDGIVNSTWVYDEDILPNGYEQLMIMFLPGKLCNFGYSFLDGQGQTNIVEECIGNYDYTAPNGTFSVTDPDNTSTHYDGSFTVDGETMTVSVMNRTFTLEKFEVPTK